MVACGMAALSVPIQGHMKHMLLMAATAALRVPIMSAYVSTSMAALQVPFQGHMKHMLLMSQYETHKALQEAGRTYERHALKKAAAGQF